MDKWITTREYSELYGIPFETVRNRAKKNQIPHIKVGNSIMIDRDTPWEERKKTGRKPKVPKEQSEVDCAKAPDVGNLLDKAAKKNNDYRRGYNDGYKDGYAKAKADILARLK